MPGQWEQQVQRQITFNNLGLPSWALPLKAGWYLTSPFPPIYCQSSIFVLIPNPDGLRWFSYLSASPPPGIQQQLNRSFLSFFIQLSLRAG